MPSFDVRFIKTVCDDTGHEHQACQAAFTVDATRCPRRCEWRKPIFAIRSGSRLDIVRRRRGVSISGGSLSRRRWSP